MLTLLTGPPRNRKIDREWLHQFLSRPGKKIVCGGTTIAILTRHIGNEPEVRMESASPGIPPWGTLEEIDLVTEGIFTLEYLVDHWHRGSDTIDVIKNCSTAPERMRILFDETEEITIMVGRGERRAEAVRKLSRLLETEGKKVTINLY